MSIVLVSSGGGQITLQEPTTASNFTQTLPAATGTAILANGSGDLQINSGFGSNATAYGCRAWVNFNGTGTPAIRGSGNVSSITDIGTGAYTVNFTTAMPDVNYSPITTVSRAGLATATPQADASWTAGTGSFQVTCTDSSNITFDPPAVLVAVFR